MLDKFSKTLTRDGWKEYTSIKVNEDEALGYNPSTMKLEWTLILNVFSFIDTRMYILSNGAWGFTASSNQEWLTEEGSTIKTENITLHTNILAQVSSDEDGVPAEIGSRRRIVTNLLIQPADIDIGYVLATGVGTWLTRFDNNTGIAYCNDYV